MEKNKKIIPEIASGFRDYLPEDMIPRQKMFDTIREVFERFGFVPLDTPALEKEEILTGGDENFKMRIFKTNVKVGEEKLALRFDLTVPLARVIAQYPNEIKKPFKRYQAGPVWRAEKPQAGRFREFAQFDADIIGAASMMADAEIISVMYETMTALGVNHFLIRVNNRKILNGLVEYAGFSPEKMESVLRIVDKLDKQGWDEVQKELTDGGLKPKETDAIKKFINIKNSDKEEILELVEKLMKNSTTALEGVAELREILKYTKALGVPDNFWTIDLSVARGLGYYTGTVFETVLQDLPSFGSVFSGGRYDGLVEKFSPNSVPATGASIGVDRLFSALKELGLVQPIKTVAKVIILNFDKTCETACLKTASFLRKADIPTEIYLGQETTLKGQLAYAVRNEAPVVIIIGSEELKKGVAQIKDMKNRKQFEINNKDSDLVSKVKDILE